MKRTANISPLIRIFPVLLISLLLFSGLSSAKIYKYQDESGNWHYTDTPMTENEDLEEVEGTIDRGAGRENLKKSLSERFQPKNEIEMASIGTVTVISPMGQGSGFFVSEDGYIITNRHVIQGDEEQLDQVSGQFEDADEKVEVLEDRFQEEEKKLEKARKQLTDYRYSIDRMKEGQRRSVEEQKYAIHMERFNRWERDFERRKSEFSSELDNYRKKKSDFNYTKSMARLARNFTVTLKDGSEHAVRLAAVSPDHDLALLKLDDAVTPSLLPGNIRALMQGAPLYAVGSPVGLRDTVSAGVFSGFHTSFIKTNAQIYPGNSGGPLINEKGEVIGINTFKQLTRKFEGLGFAIPIDTALKEFSRHLRP